MKKLWMIARKNILKTKSVSVILIIMFLVSGLLLNAGLSVSMNYGNHFEALKEELNPADAYLMMSSMLYTEEIKDYIENNEVIEAHTVQEGIWLDTEISYQDKNQSFSVMFQNMEEERSKNKWKYIGEHEEAGEMSVYVPEVFHAVGNYQVNDKIELTYQDETGEKASLVFTVKGYTEDIFFSSLDTGMMAFYVTEDTYQEVKNKLSAEEYGVTTIFAEVENLNDVSKMENEMREILNLNSASMMTTDTSTLLISIDIELVEMSRCMMANMMAIMMVVFAIIIVIVCLLVVRFRIVNSIEDDVVKIGSLKSIGYTSKQIIGSILLQFTFLAGIGTILGIVFSYPILPGVSLVFERQSGLRWEPEFDLAITLMTLLVILSIVVIVTIMSARHVRKLNPIDALRGQSSSRKYKKNRMPLEKARGNLVSTLAWKSILQNIKQNMMMVVILFAVSFSGSFGVIMYYNTTINTRAFSEVPGMEICNAVATLNPSKDQKEALEIIQNMDSVRKTLYLDEVKAKVADMDVAVYVMEDYGPKESRLVYEGHYPEKSGEMAIAGILAERLGKKIGDKVTVETGDKKETFEIVGLSNGSSMGGLNTSILLADYQKLNPEFKQQILNIYLEEGTDAAEFISELEDKISKEVLLGAINFDKLMAEGMESYRSIVALMGVAMLGITVFIVALVLYFMISSSVIRKKKELGIQKAIGFTTFQLMNQISLNFMVPIILGTVVGSTLGSLYTNSLMSIAMKGMGIMKAMFIVDIPWMIGFAAATLIVSYLLCLLITWRIRKISAYELVTE